MNKAHGLIVGIVCLSFGSLLSAAPSSSSRRSPSLPLCSSEWSELHITADNDFDIYIEGTRYKNLYHSNNWTMSDYVPLVWYPSAVAVKATDNGAMAGILGSSPLFLTDASWKCTNEYEDGWEQPSFDDSTWPAATVIGKHGVAPWGQVGGISSEASWIWTSKYIYGPDSDKIVYCRKKFCQRCPSTGPSCIKSCDGLTDGPYQSCNGCSTFVICDHGEVKERFCAVADAEGNRLKWRDDVKTCDYESNTCRDCHDVSSVTTTNPTPPEVNITIQSVAPSSPPCSTGSSCIRSCSGLKDGDYQSCKGCQVYASCSNGILYDERPCAPSNTYWDDRAKQCVYRSSTCRDCHGVSPVPAANPVPAEVAPSSPPCSTGPSCISSCKGLKNGDYQSCKGCQVYASCSNEILYDERPCAPSNTYWDDIAKQCVYRSSTCTACSKK